MNFRTNAKVYVGYKKGEDYDPKSVRAGPKGGTAPEFKCFSKQITLFLWFLEIYASEWHSFLMQKQFSCCILQSMSYLVVNLACVLKVCWIVLLHVFPLIIVMVWTSYARRFAWHWVNPTILVPLQAVRP